MGLGRRLRFIILRYRFMVGFYFVMGKLVNEIERLCFKIV